MNKPLVLMILDGYGVTDEIYGNAVTAANTPNLDRFNSKYPHTTIGASGMDVGLPDGQMGNSEVGHTNIGAGRVVYQELTRISKAIVDGDFFTNEAIVEAIDNCKKNNTALHLIGLLSDGGVHSHNTHLYALLKLAKEAGLVKVFVHCLMDGRDVPPDSGKRFVAELVAELERIGVGNIATIMGRYYAMDRDNRWDRVEKAYNAIVHGEGNTDYDALHVMQASYDAGITDEFVMPTICIQGGQLNDNDSVIFFNFRPDRAREITRTLVDPDFDGFKRKNPALKLHYVCMTQYDSAMPNVYVAYHPQSLANTFGKYISDNGLKQLRIAETEKYAHVTFFYNGGIESPYEGEDRALIPSPKVATYDMQPEMSANLVTEELLKRLDSGKYDVVILNFANCDMVGHTGVFDAAVAAVEAVDSCVGTIVDKILSLGGIALITADHGNADKMYEKNGSPFTAHTTNAVPFIVIGAGDVNLAQPGTRKLADISPTMLGLLSLPQPAEMSGQSIIL